MNIIIPLGGIGQRFKNEDYTQPKSLIKIFGKPMIFWVLDNLNINKDDNVIIIYNKELEKYNFEQIINEKYNIKCIKLEKQTGGATETIMYGLKSLDDKTRNRNTVCLDGDTFYKCDILEMYRNNPGNRVFSFKTDYKEPVYSYVKVDDNLNISEIAEKVKISNYANTGCYCFENGNELLYYIKLVLTLGIQQKNEYYTSCVIDTMLKDKKSFKSIVIEEKNICVLGTPLQVRIFLNNEYNMSQKYRFCFDLDNTLVTRPQIDGNYATVRPINRNIQFIRFLKSLGHYIIIFTARRMRTHKGNVGKIMKDVGRITINTLDNYNIPYDELVFGKPYAHFYIDDLAISAHLNLEKELGFYYKTKIEERDFHEVELKENIVIKKSTSKTMSISGEIYWYLNIPDNIIHYFPKLINHEENKLVIEKINGISLSILFINGCLNNELLRKLLTSINNIHNSMKLNDDKSIYLNYSKKIKKRYESYFYQQYPKSKEIYAKLINYFNNYEDNEMGETSVIHGDPVFTNILLDKNCEFKFIDMRGKLGDKLTIVGDKYYDLGKIYQSLIGYDLILLDKEVDEKYQNDLINYFVSLFTKEEMEKIKYVCASLLFTLIPLHANDKCDDYYNLILKYNLI